jgi:hypothetical protein
LTRDSSGWCTFIFSNNFHECKHITSLEIYNFFIQEIVALLLSVLGKWYQLVGGHLSNMTNVLLHRFNCRLSLFLISVFSKPFYLPVITAAAANAMQRPYTFCGDIRYKEWKSLSDISVITSRKAACIAWFICVDCPFQISPQIKIWRRKHPYCSIDYFFYQSHTRVDIELYAWLKHVST